MNLAAKFLGTSLTMNLTSIFHIAVRLFSIQSQMTSKRWQDDLRSIIEQKDIRRQWSLSFKIGKQNVLMNSSTCLSSHRSQVRTNQIKRMI